MEAAQGTGDQRPSPAGAARSRSCRCARPISGLSIAKAQIPRKRRARRAPPAWNSTGASTSSTPTSRANSRWSRQCRDAGSGSTRKKRRSTGENAAAGGARDLDARGLRGGVRAPRCSEAALAKLHGRAGRSRGGAQPDRALAARDDRAARRGSSAQLADDRPRGGRNRRADRRAGRSGGEEGACRSRRRRALGEPPRRLRRRREGGRRGARRRKCCATAAAGSARRTRPHRDRGAHARQDAECRDRRPVPGGAGADHGRPRL